MSFVAQVRLSDVPTLPGDPYLLSFHYCLACAEAGQMSFGSSDAGNRGFALTFHPYEEVNALDGLGAVAPGCLPSISAAFNDADEVPGLEDAWALDLKEPPELFSGGEDDFDEDVGLGLIHVARSKVGGWPHWVQAPEWPTCCDGRTMTFVMQLDYDLCKTSPWAGGGYAYLFACGVDCRHREASLVIQTA